MRKDKLLKLFLEDVKELISMNDNFMDYTYDIITSEINDLKVTYEVDYYIYDDNIEIERIYNIHILEAERETDFTNLLEFLNKELC